jgi:hypothetical protein
MLLDKGYRNDRAKYAQQHLPGVIAPTGSLTSG